MPLQGRIVLAVAATRLVALAKLVDKQRELLVLLVLRCSVARV